MQSPDRNNATGLDAQLQDVPLPEGMLERLKWIALADDEGLDAAVSEVPIPAGFTDRLRQVALEDDETLDEVLRAVVMPAGVMGRLHTIAPPPSRLQRWGQLAAAASLLIAIGISYIGAAFGVLVAAFPTEEQPTPNPIELVATFTDQSELDMPTVELALDPYAPRREPAPEVLTRLPEIEWTDPGRDPERSALAEVRQFINHPRYDMFVDTELMRWSVLGERPDSSFDEISDLPIRAGSALERRGVMPPLVPQYPKSFLVAHKVHPFVLPAAHPDLQTSQVPLGVTTASYELTWRHLQRGELPPRDEVRIEDFLAAIDYQFPAPGQEALRVSMSAGPSPFGGQGLYLLQVGVQARKPRPNRHEPVHLVLAVDTSASMRWGGRLEMIRRATGELVNQLGPDDRLSLVTFSEKAHVLLEEVRPDATEQVRQAVDQLKIDRFTNVRAGLAEAYRTAERGATFRDGITRVVLLTDGMTTLSQGASDLIEQRLAEAARRDLRLEVVNLGQEILFDRQLERLAEAGGGHVFRAGSADEIGWALSEIATGQTQLVASDAQLKVTFNPKSVLWYRLIGHEIRNTLPANASTDFHAGQQATALYEIYLLPKPEYDVATAELSWQSPDGGESQYATRTIQKKQFAESFDEATPSLQAAALAAEAAEILRGSYYAPMLRGLRSPALARVLEVAETINTELYQRPSFADFMSMVERAAELEPHRGGTGR